jgi:GT2 family glycosyltransferase
MSSLVSVIIPCKNGADWLADAIESCLRQTWKDREIIVIDDGSTDASLHVARRYESAAVIVLRSERSGASAARNVGIARARGDFIQFLDADDLLDPDKLRIQIERLAHGPELSVASGAWTRFRSDPGEATFTVEPVWRDFSPADFLIASWQGGGMMPNFVWLTPRGVIANAGPWNETLSLNDDGEFFSRVVLASSQILFCANARGYYRSAADTTLSRRHDDAALASALEAIRLSCEHLLRHGESPSAKAACATQFQRFVFDAYPDRPDLVQAAERRVEALGGSPLRIGGGRGFQLIARAFGWKLAKRCRRAWHAANPFPAAGSLRPADRALTEKLTGRTEYRG